MTNLRLAESCSKVDIVKPVTQETFVIVRLLLSDASLVNQPDLCLLVMCKHVHTQFVLNSSSVLQLL